MEIFEHGPKHPRAETSMGENGPKAPWAETSMGRTLGSRADMSLKLNMKVLFAASVEVPAAKSSIT